MFAIKCIEDPSVKIHFTSSVDVAQEVCADLAARFGKCTIEKDYLNKENCTWDPGGCLMMGDKEFSFDLSTIKMLCKAQHFNCLLQYVSDTEERGVTQKYYKLHGAYICICFSPEEFGELKREIRCTKYLNDADAAWIKKNDAIADIMSYQSVSVQNKKDLN